MCAGVVECVKRAADVCHGDLGVLNVKRQHVTLPQIVRSAHRYELSHSFGLLVRLRIKTNGRNILCTRKGILDTGTVGKANEFAADSETNEQELQAAC